MDQLLAISRNTFLQTVRQPVYGIIVLATLGVVALSPPLTGWTMDDDNKLLRDIGLSTLLIQGLFLACFAASAVINTEIEDKTILTSAAKPVGRWIFVVGKHVGVLGAVAAAHYLATIAVMMAIRHGVMQTSADKMDMTVLIFGPGMMILLMILAAVANFAFDWRFLPTVVTLALPGATLGAGLLLVVDRDWHLRTPEVAQEIVSLPSEVVGENKLRGIVEFRPDPGQGMLEGNSGELVRKTWDGPVSDEDRAYLLNLSVDTPWKKAVNWLVLDSRKMQGPEIIKAAILILIALAVLSSVAVAAATRVGTVSTFLICIVAVCLGLTSDYYLKPLADTAAWADVAYRCVPNFQFFWMVDALSDDRVIPWGYVGAAAGYAAVFCLGFLALGAALFETREVG